MPREILETTSHRVELQRTFGYLRMGAFDPTCTLREGAGGELVKVVVLDDGAVIRHTITALPGGDVRVTVEGDAVAEQLAAWRAALDAARDDGHDTFAPQREHLALRFMVRELPGLRFVRVPWLFDFACAIVLQQRVRYEEALREYGAIVERLGHDTSLGRAFPSAARLARVSSAELQALGVDPRRAATLLRLAREHALHRICDEPSRDVLARRLHGLVGIGPWTTGMVLAFGAGDPDAVPLGDLYLPHTLAQVLAHERRGSDDRMLALLAPYAGQRGRVIRLVTHAKFHAPALLNRR